MPYKVFYGDYDDEEIKEVWSEKNKDEVIDRLLWLLRRLEYQILVEYPDGEIY